MRRQTQRLGPAESRQAQNLRGGDSLHVLPRGPLEEQGEAHLVPQVQRVVGDGAVGAEGDTQTRRPQPPRKGGDARAQFGVAFGAVGHGGPGCGEQIDVFLRLMDTVDGQCVRPSAPRPAAYWVGDAWGTSQAMPRRANISAKGAGPPFGQFTLGGELGDVDARRQPFLGDVGIQRGHQFGTDGIKGVGGHAEMDPG